MSASPPSSRSSTTPNPRCASTTCAAGRSRWAGAAEQITVIDIDQGHSGASRRRPGRVPAPGRRGRHRPGRDRARPGMLTAGPQQRRLAPAARDLRPDRHPDLRRRRPLRPPRLQRPAAAGHERPSQRSRTAFPPLPAARRDPVQGPPRRADHRRCPSVWPTTPPARWSSTPSGRPTRRDAPVRHLRRHRVGARLVKTFTHAGLLFPCRHRKGPRKGELDWAPLQHSRRAAGAAQPPLRRRVHLRPAPRPEHAPTARPRPPNCPASEWTAFIPGAHPGYITLRGIRDQQARLAETPPPTAATATGPPREGPALLQGIIICGRCGTRMTVRYHHRRGQAIYPSTSASATASKTPSRICTSLPGGDLDQRSGGCCIDTLTPLAVEAALTVAAELEQRAAKPTGCAPPPSNAPATTPTWPAAATWPSTPPTGWSPTPSKPTGTPPCAHSARQEAYDTARQQHPGQLTDAQRPGSTNWSPTYPRSGTTPPPPPGNANASPDCSLTDVTVTANGDIITAHVRFPGGQHTTLTLPAPKPAAELRKTPTPRSSPTIDDYSTTTPAPRSPTSSTSAT